LSTSSSSGRGRNTGRGGLRFNRFLFALQIRAPALPPLNFIILLAHNGLYFVRSFRFCVTMMIGWNRFNIYLLLAVSIASFSGCQSPERQRNRQLTRFELHLES